MDIGLTLSGGGFRATLFHLGVISYLRESGLLKQVKFVTAVSGGSITAAHLAINWDRYSGSDEQFKEVADELIAFTQLGVREHIIAWLPVVLILKAFRRVTPSRWRVDESVMLRRMYNRFLFKNKPLSAMRANGAPEVNLAATNLTRPDNLVSFCGNGVYLHGDDGVFIPSQVANIALAVAASSAFPLLFPPILIDAKMLGVNEATLVPSSQYLSDGGIFDNYGSRALSYLQAEKKQLDLLIVSDAGARAGWRPNKGFSRFALLNRAAAITGQRVSDLELTDAKRKAFANDLAVLSIHDEVPKHSADILAEDLQRQLGSVRTDLDQFSDLLVHCLGTHGYAIARHEIPPERIAHWSGETPAVPTHWLPLAPNNPTTGNVERDMFALQKAAVVRFHLFSLREWRPLLIYFVALLLTYWFLPGIIASTIDFGNSWIHEFSRTSWNNGEVPLAKLEMADKAFLETLQDSMSEREKDQYRMDRWLRWAGEGIRPSSVREAALVIESEEFDGYYKEFTAAILCEKHVKVSEAVAFLVSTSGPVTTFRPTYRQMHIETEQTGEKPSTVTIASPNKGEHVLLIIRVLPKSNDPEAKPPHNPTLYNISLRTQ